MTIELCARAQELQLLRPPTTATEACALEPMLHNKRKHPMRSPHTAVKTGLRSPQLEKSPLSNKHPAQSEMNGQINKYIKI